MNSKKIRVLQISNDFANSKVHSNLFYHLCRFDIFQNVYCPVRTIEEIGKNNITEDNIKVYYSYCIKPWYKFLYYFKLNVLYKDLKRNVDLENHDVIHACTLFSDGGLAYKAYKEYGIPYIIAIRKTDTDIFMRYLPHSYFIGRKILLNASRIYFISESLKQKFEESKMFQLILPNIRNKFVVQPNGIDNIWIKNMSIEPRIGHDILYVGDFTPNKNVTRLILAVDKIRKETEFKDIRLIIVGGGRDKNSEVLNTIEKYHDFVQYKGKVYDKIELLKIMRSCSVFAMPSIHETFGLVYLEALSQNIPVIFSKKQGIYGMFDNSAGESVNPYSVQDIFNGIKKVLDNPSFYGNHNIKFELFDWQNISYIYYKEYLKLIK